ncbi:oxidoreductase-like domain-containing protein [Jeongeupia chitinilytica]|uniref:Oxidoreductase-like domain-containing protein n=1 Tax=Jeongeupia chitinilytica TaxID=1041641 RepID=A0ABQ3GUY7_9NEIS|nr:oxidoreductase-like domain-containing protein [Jeongeupia chitinilytica]GHD56352.1 hypothetical protein GCM10007350_03250 [Jeongeupia chitinilytica]
MPTPSNQLADNQPADNQHVPDFPADDPPPEPPFEPALEECCGSGCEPCIFDTYTEALHAYRRDYAAWLQRHPEFKDLPRR